LLENLQENPHGEPVEEAAREPVEKTAGEPIEL